LKERVKYVFLHCIIHQEALCGKIIKINQTMKVVVNIVNLIRGGNKAQRHRAFITFLEEMDADYGDIPLHCDIRWLSAGKCSQLFFFLRQENKFFCFFNLRIWDKNSRGSYNTWDPYVLSPFLPI
jgi:hypothetical protein